MSDLPQYPQAPPPQTHVPERIQRSIERTDAFSKPGTTKPSGKGWQPAKGVRFRQTIEKAPGRPRKRKPDPRKVRFY